MEIFIWIGRGVFLAVVIIAGVRTMLLNRSFQRYLKENHLEHWQRIYQEQIIKKALLWPFMHNTPVDFLWKSRENFGDPKITELRRQVQKGFLGTIVAGIAAVVWFVISEALRAG